MPLERAIQTWSYCSRKKSISRCIRIGASTVTAPAHSTSHAEPEDQRCRRRDAQSSLFHGHSCVVVLHYKRLCRRYKYNTYWKGRFGLKGRSYSILCGSGGKYRKNRCRKICNSNPLSHRENIRFKFPHTSSDHFLHKCCTYIGILRLNWPVWEVNVLPCISPSPATLVSKKLMENARRQTLGSTKSTITILQWWIAQEFLLLMLDDDLLLHTSKREWYSVLLMMIREYRTY